LDPAHLPPPRQPALLVLPRCGTHSGDQWRVAALSSTAHLRHDATRELIARGSRRRHQINGPARTATGRHAADSGARPERATFIRRRIVAGVLVCCLIFIAVMGISLVGSLTNPANGSSVTTRFAEWTREHGGSSIANWIENEYYTHHQPKVGGKPQKGLITAARSTSTVPAPSAPAHLAAPHP